MQGIYHVYIEFLLLLYIVHDRPLNQISPILTVIN